MTYLLEEHTGTDGALIAGGMASLETYDELQRERSARADAEATAAQLAELIAAEHIHVAEARREVAELRALLESERARADDAERRLGVAIVNDYSQAIPPSLWEQFKQRRRGR
jgi:hypothetical protein